MTDRYDPIYQRLVVPIRPHVDAELFVPFPMSEADWGQFQAVLDAMKPGLVREQEWEQDELEGTNDGQ